MDFQNYKYIFPHIHYFWIYMADFFRNFKDIKQKCFKQLQIFIIFKRP
jgi:hypothetical protein